MILTESVHSFHGNQTHVQMFELPEHCCSYLIYLIHLQPPEGSQTPVWKPLIQIFSWDVSSRSNPPHQSEWSSDMMICVLLEAPGIITGVPQSFSYVRGTPDLSPQLAHSHTQLHKPVCDRGLINVFAFSTIPLCNLYTHSHRNALTLCMSEPQRHTHTHTLLKQEFVRRQKTDCSASERNQMLHLHTLKKAS